MARVLTAQDAHVLMNALVKQATGQTTVTSTNLSTFVSAGETVLATGVENTLNALSLVLGKTFVAVRPYKAKASIIDALNTGEYSNRLRKISYYSREALSSGDWNTQLNGSNLGMDRDNGALGVLDAGSGSATASMWEQHQPVPLEMNFAGQNVWEDSTSVYRYQLKVAFSSPEDFAAFVNGIMVEKGNDIESQKEAYNRMTLLNFIAGVYDLDAASPNGRVVNLTTAFNTYYGTNYNTAALLSTYLKDFLEFMVATIKTDSDRLTHRSARYHWSPAKTINGVNYTILRHTPKDKQKLALYNPLFKKAEAMVLPEIFNDNYLKMDNYEGFDYWQSFNGTDANDMAINITPAIPDTSGTTQIAGTAVSLEHLIGVLFDTDACMVDYQLEDSLATPVEARKRYYNIWWSFSKNSINDFTENAIVYMMDDSGVTP